MRKFFLITILILLVAGLFYYRVDLKNWWLAYNQPTLPAAQDYQSIKNNLNTVNDHEITAATKTAEILTPTEINLQVPFTAQAPEGIWDEDFKEGCEEASLLMVDAFYNDYELTTELASQKIMAMINWQKQNWQGHFDLTLAQTADLALAMFNYKNFAIIDNPTVEQIKSYLSQGQPIIIPAAGRLLGNPHFQTPGPLYHMLVIKGYTEDGFITNDPGTKFGADYFYSYQTIMNALADWQTDDFDRAPKRILVITP